MHCPFLLSYGISLTSSVAGSAHGALTAPAATGRSALFLIADHAFDDQGNDHDQHQADDDRSEVFR